MTNETKLLDVEAFHRESQTVLFSNGTTAPITNWFDSDGVECGPFDQPATAIAGPDGDGSWYWFKLSDFEPKRMH